MFNLSLPFSRAPVHVVTGSAGCQEDTDKFQRKCSLYTASMLSQGSVVGVEGRAVSNRTALPGVPPEWSAFRSSDYGYTRLAADRTAIHIQQVGNAAFDSRPIHQHLCKENIDYRWTWT